jgi:hypothetical protein
MQWMQIRRPLLALASGAAVCLCFTAPNCYAVIKQQAATPERLIELPPITVSKRMQAKTTQMRQSPRAPRTAAMHEQTVRGLQNGTQRVTLRGIPGNVNHRTGRHFHQFRDPHPGDRQPCVRYLEPPTPLEHLPSSTVLVHQELPPGYKLKYVYRLRPFTRIVADSDINITLRNSNTPQVAVMNRDQPGRDLIITTVKNGTLYLKDASTPRDARVREPLQVLVDANGIEMIRLNDKSSIYAPNYRAYHFNVVSYSSGNILLHGPVNADHIEHHGAGMISLDSVNVNKLEIFSSGPGLIRLAGSVDNLTVRGVRNAKIDAKYLRTQDAVIQSSGTSEIAVSADNSLNGFASGYSYIYYYKTPTFIVPRTYNSGNIIQMQYWD